MIRELVAACPLMLALAVTLLFEPLPWRIYQTPEPPEPTWSEQIAAVRSGRQKVIVVERQIVTDQNLADLAGLDRLIKLELGQSEVTAAGVQQLQALPNFRRLVLRGRPVDDKMLKAICEIATLRDLVIPQSHITDAGLAALAQKPQLAQLRISSPQITDAGLATIAQLKKLRFLHLIDLSITDAGLEQLQGMANLESLYIDGSPVTDAGIERLLNKLPDLHLHIDQQHFDRDPKRGTHTH